MSISLPDVYQENSQWIGPPSADPAEAVLASMVAGQFLCVVVHSEGPVRARFLERLVPALPRDHIRVIRTTNQASDRFDLRCLMNQVIGPGYTDGPDAVEQFFAALTRPGTGESRLVLIIDNAHLLTDQALRYLDLLVSITNLAAPSLQLLLLGQLGLWERLAAFGHLTADKVCIRISLADEGDLTPDAATPEGSAAGGPKVPPTIRIPADLSMRAVSAQTPAQGGEAKRPARSGARPGKSTARGLAWAALASAILIGGGAAAIRLRDPRSGPVMPRDSAAQPAAPGTGEADPAPVAVGKPPEHAKQAALAPAIDPAGAGNPDKAATAVPSEFSATAANSTDIAAPGMDARGAAAVPAGVEARKSEGSPEPPAAKPADAVAAAPMPAGAGANGAEQTGAAPETQKPDTALAAGTGATSGPTSFLPFSSSVLASLLTRGNMLLADGDIAAARLLFERAAAASSGPAAFALGETYDPRFLARIGARSVSPDPRRAMIWYHRASDLGSAEARRLLAKLSAQNGQ